MELVYSIIFLIIGYGFGSFSTGYVVGRMSGHNIQSEGSGNIGTTVNMISEYCSAGRESRMEASQNISKEEPKIYYQK